jgi:tRNA dimethylallyltransferase
MSENAGQFNAKATPPKGSPVTTESVHTDGARTDNVTVETLIAGIAAAPPARPVLIAGPTASGKSGLALRIARACGGVIVNADAIQVYARWQVLSARPDAAALSEAPHLLYGHVAADVAYSTGHWLREVAPILADAARGTGQRPIIVGGTGLYFTALTEGLAEIPPTPDDVRAAADARLRAEGATALLAELDEATRAAIDTANPTRIQRAWEVLATTGTGLAAWQARTPPPLLPLHRATAIALHAAPDWLIARIDSRLDAMVAAGALEEVARELPLMGRNLPSEKAIGAPEFAAHLRGEITLDTALEAARIATRRYAKRQRTWLRARMRGWRGLALPGCGCDVI